MFDNDIIVGSVAKKDNHISTLFVNHKFRKQGIGLLLLNFIETKIKSEGFKTAELTSGPTALTWYEAQGYSSTGKQFDRGELIGIHMSKNLQLSLEYYKRSQYLDFLTLYHLTISLVLVSVLGQSKLYLLDLEKSVELLKYALLTR